MKPHSMTDAEVQEIYKRIYLSGATYLANDFAKAIIDARDKQWELSASPQPPQADVARDALTKAAIKLAYGHLWHVNNEPMAPIPLYEPEKAAYQARKALRDLLTHEERGEAINAVCAAMSVQGGK